MGRVLCKFSIGLSSPFLNFAYTLMQNVKKIQILLHNSLTELITFEVRQNCFNFPSEKRSTLKGNYLPPFGANAFPSEWTLFVEEIRCRSLKKLFYLFKYRKICQMHVVYSVDLTLSMLGKKKTAGVILKYVSYLSPENRLWHFNANSLQGHNLH